MVRTMVYLTEELHRCVKHLAIERRTSFAKLVQEALEVLYREDIEDFRIGRMRFKEFREKPKRFSSYSAYRAKRLKA